MSRTKHLRGQCQHCGGSVEFLAENIGLTADCPHCSRTTELLLEVPPEPPTVPRRVLVWTGIAVLVLVLGLVGALIALKRAERWAARQKGAAAGLATDGTFASPTPTSASAPIPALPPGLTCSDVAFVPGSGDAGAYVGGTVRNASPRQRSGLKVTLDLLNAAGQKVGAATDSLPLLGPGAEWHFKAPVAAPEGAVSARVARLSEAK
jgi:hypothetical protein